MYNQNPTVSDTQQVDNGAVDYGDDGSRVQGYGPPPHGSQFDGGWYNPNQNGYYQPMQTYPSPDPIVQHAFNQEHYAAQLSNHYQSVAEQSSKMAEEKAACVEQENEWLHQTIQQQSTVPDQSQFSAPTQFSTPNADAMLAGQLASQAAASAAPPILSQSATTIPATIT